jgi:N-acyl-D-aspartate/D-glutamate deacylase
MPYDLLIRNGTIVDGTGAPAVRGNVAITGGRIVETGQVDGAAVRTIDAGGLVVAPGFIDMHTHMDAQVLWDPYATSEPQHGITSIVTGNCGLTLAPVKETGRDALVKSFVRVEAIPREALEQAVPWNWESFGEYLGALEGRIGVNVGGLVGHIAVRHYVLGEEAVERAATPDEIGQMRQIVRESLEAGALGLSTNRNTGHTREDGKPVASRLADEDERAALFGVLRELKSGMIQLSSPGVNTAEQIPWYGQVSLETGRPVVWQSILHRWSNTALWRQQLDAVAVAFAAGSRAYGLTNSTPVFTRFSLKNAQTFDAMPAWKALMFAPEPVRMQAFADPETRAKLRADWADPKPLVFHRRWDLIQVIKVAKPENERYVSKSVADIAAMQGKEPLDAFLDLAIDEGLETVFETMSSGGDPEAVGEILRSPYVLMGQSDAGAHVQYTVNFGFATTLLGYWVRDRQVLSLEQAVHKLTGEVASAFEIGGRGVLKPGYAADVTVFDPATIGACEPEWADDYPGGVRRLVQRSEGVHFTIVNGRPIYDEGRLTGDLPGQVMRGTAYRPG